MMTKTLYPKQIVLDTETTGLNTQGPVQKDHRIIEIGAVELIHRIPQRTLQIFLNPGIPISAESIKVHGITDAMVAQHPVFNHSIAAQILAFFEGAELIAHNAPFDLAFLNQEFQLLGFSPLNPSSSVFLLQDRHPILDTLALARKKFPFARNGLDPLCKRLEIDNTHRQLHGALLDARLLTEVYLALTGGQSLLDLPDCPEPQEDSVPEHASLNRKPLQVLRHSNEEYHAHEALLHSMRPEKTTVLLDKLLIQPVTHKENELPQ